MPIDPVCGMTVDEQTAPATAVHNGTTYYFCAPGCKRTFEKDPEAVLKGGPLCWSTDVAARAIAAANFHDQELLRQLLSLSYTCHFRPRQAH